MLAKWTQPVPLTMQDALQGCFVECPSAVYLWTAFLHLLLMTPVFLPHPQTMPTLPLVKAMSFRLAQSVSHLLQTTYWYKKGYKIQSEFMLMFLLNTEIEESQPGAARGHREGQAFQWKKQMGMKIEQKDQEGVPRFWNLNFWIQPWLTLTLPSGLPSYLSHYSLSFFKKAKTLFFWFVTKRIVTNTIYSHNSHG